MTSTTQAPQATPSPRRVRLSYPMALCMARALRDVAARSAPTPRS